MDKIIEFLFNLSLITASFLLLLENIFIFTSSVLIGNLAVKVFNKKRIGIPPNPIEKREVIYSINTILFNTLITIIGYFLWKKGIINFRDDFSYKIIFDVIILITVMDFTMYILHRVAHISFIFPIIHKLHHYYENPRPLTLFILSPAEALGFGILWLVVISCYSFSWIGMSIYLAFNVAWGIIGHLGVEPFPNKLLNNRFLKYISSSTFHFTHHQKVNYNYGFYTTIWDKLFKTLYM